MAKVIIGIVVALVVIVVGRFIPVPLGVISVAAEAIGFGPILTNALFTSIIISIVIIVMAFFIGRGLKEQPGGLQNVVEMLLEGLNGLVTTIASKKWAPTFFPIVATIFIWLLFANYTSLFTPFFASFGVIFETAADDGMPASEVIFIKGDADHLPPMHHPGQELHAAEGQAAEGDHAEGEAGETHVAIVPLFRAPSSDLNLTFALAIVTMVLVQIFGFREQGFKYVGHFIRVDSFSKKGLGMGLIDFFLGLVELISEVAKILSFSFRLFGNIFAGEVLMMVIVFLVPLLVLVIVFGLEIFVGTIQAFVFFILALVFFTIATSPHGEEH